MVGLPCSTGGRRLVGTKASCPNNRYSDAVSEQWTWTRLALFAFNIGVEVGQLMFIAAVLALLAVADVSIFHQSLGSRARHATTYGIGALAGFWFIERLAGVGL
jgi:hypothetical protein